MSELRVKPTSIAKLQNCRAEKKCKKARKKQYIQAGTPNISLKHCPTKRAGVSLFIKQKALTWLHVNLITIHLCYQLKLHQSCKMHSSGIRNGFNYVSYRTDTLARINEKI